jgi:flagellar biosynthesis anti-sigma factor FlgM
MKINNTPNTDALKAYNQQSLQGVHLNKDKESTNNSKPTGAPLSDKVNISSTVKLMQDVIKSVSEAPDVRTDKVNEIQTKIEKGLYKPDLNVVADKLLSPNISDRI